MIKKSFKNRFNIHPKSIKNCLVPESPQNDIREKYRKNVLNTTIRSIDLGPHFGPKVKESEITRR